jgi:hypothetical protein
MRSYLEKIHHKKGWGSGLRCRPWVQTPVSQKKKKKHENLGSLAGEIRNNAHYILELG